MDLRETFALAILCKIPPPPLIIYVCMSDLEELESSQQFHYLSSMSLTTM